MYYWYDNKWIEYTESDADWVKMMGFKTANKMEQKIEEMLSKYPERLRCEIANDLREFAQSQAVEVISKITELTERNDTSVYFDKTTYAAIQIIKKQFDLPL